jgi:hypothetical protein
MCTVHAPQAATPQPNLVPVRFRWSRKTHNSGVSGSASTLVDRPLILNVITGVSNALSQEVNVCDVFDLPRTKCPRVLAACRTQDDLAATVPENRNQSGPYFTALSFHIPDMRSFLYMREIVKILLSHRFYQTGVSLSNT